MSPSTRKPDMAAVLNAAAAAYLQGRLREAAALYQQVAADDPHDLRAIYSLALIDIRLGDLHSARTRLKAVIAVDPTHYPAYQNLGAVCQTLDQWPEAADAYARAHQLNPSAVESHFSLARALVVLGRLQEASACYRALVADPAVRLRALTRLAALAPADIDDQALTELVSDAKDPAVSSAARTEACFALAEVFERRGDDDAAFEALANGNRMKYQSLAASADPAVHPDAVEREHERAVQFVIDRFDADVFANSTIRGSNSRSPIFIVGMPRSGSSLVEQILSSHTQIRSMGESESLPGVVERGFNEADRSRNWLLMADEYLALMRKNGWNDTAHFVDKTLENHLRVGAIHLMFPNALILESVRGPVDTCLSCYRQLFADGNETLYDLAQIGRAYVRYRRVMEHWERVLPGRVIRVEHENLVADSDRQIRWLITEVCQLSWEPACLLFHQTAGAVRTASAAQVRQPIFKTSVGRWARFANDLGPLLQALGPYAPS